MNNPLIEKYIKTLNRRKGLVTAIFSSIMSVSGILALQPSPPPEYYAEAVLVDNSPLVLLTETEETINELGRRVISEDRLLSEVLLNKVSQQLNERGLAFSPNDIRENTAFSISSNTTSETSTNTNSIEAIENVSTEKVTENFRIDLRFISDDPETAEIVLNMLLQVMVEFSRASNKARLEAIIEEVDSRVLAFEESISEEIDSLKSTKDEIEIARISNYLRIKNDYLLLAIAKRVDAEFATLGVVSSLTIASPPVPLVNEPEEINRAAILVGGLAVSFIAIGWAVFLLGNSDEKDKNKKRINQNHESLSINL